MGLIVGEGQPEQVGEVGDANVVFDARRSDSQQPAHGVVAQGDDQGEGDDLQAVELDSAQDGVADGRREIGDFAGLEFEAVDRRADEQGDAVGGGLGDGNGQQPDDDAFDVGTDVFSKWAEHARLQVSD